MRVEGLPRRHFWSQFARHAGLTGLDVERGLVFDTEILTVQYVLSGSGIALVDLDLFRDHLSAGRLVQPYATTLNDGFGYYLVTDPEALSDTATALFRSWLIEQFGPETKSAVATAGRAAANTSGVQ
jgi:DNA-binding transcriptional LysR family regulator